VASVRATFASAGRFSAMRRHLMVSLVLTAIASAVIAGSVAAAPRLSGPSTMRVLQKVTFKATGLRDGRYALFVAKSVRRSGHAYRCVAFLSATRPVSGGTDLFHGSVPDGVSCRRAGGSAVDFTRSIPLGRYRLYVCRPTPAAYCSTLATQLGKAVTVRR
jgi:hypothetical protein